MTQALTYDDFARQALAVFPDLAEDIASVGEYRALGVSAFAERLQRAKGAADWDTYERGIRLVEALWDSADPELAGALRWTLMKGLDFDGPRGPVAWACLSPDLQRAWTATHRKLEALSALPSKPKRRR